MKITKADVLAWFINNFTTIGGATVAALANALESVPNNAGATVGITYGSIIVTTMSHIGASIDEGKKNDLTWKGWIKHMVGPAIGLTITATLLFFYGFYNLGPHSLPTIWNIAITALATVATPTTKLLLDNKCFLVWAKSKLRTGAVAPIESDEEQASDTIQSFIKTSEVLSGVVYPSIDKVLESLTLYLQELGTADTKGCSDVYISNQSLWREYDVQIKSIGDTLKEILIALGKETVSQQQIIDEQSSKQTCRAEKNTLPEELNRTMVAIAILKRIQHDIDKMLQQALLIIKQDTHKNSDLNFLVPKIIKIWGISQLLYEETETVELDSGNTIALEERLPVDAPQPLSIVVEGQHTSLQQVPAQVMELVDIDDTKPDTTEEVTQESGTHIHQQPDPIVTKQTTYNFEDLRSWRLSIQFLDQHLMSSKFGLEPYDVDYQIGDCLFEAIAAFVPPHTGADMRRLAIEHIEHDQELKQRIKALAGNKTTAIRIKSGKEVVYHTEEEYIQHMQKGQTWGTEIEILAIARQLQRPIIILPSNDRYIWIVEEKEYAENEPIFIEFQGDNHYVPLSTPNDSRVLLDHIRAFNAEIKDKKEIATSAQSVVSKLNIKSSFFGQQNLAKVPDLTKIGELEKSSDAEGGKRVEEDSSLLAIHPLNEW